jgi:3-methyladenine DNA glycosylase AlkD
MTANEVLTSLKKLGKPQTAAIYKRHGAGDDVFGVLTSELAKLRKRIVADDALAAQLWKTGNAEARILALQITDPETLTRAKADAFLKEGRSRFFGLYVAGLVARSPIADKTMRAWMKSRDELAREVGYDVLSVRLREDARSVSDTDAARILATIEEQIHDSPNFARHAMNNALMAIGVFKPALRAKAVAAAKRIGPIDVDHGQTSCKTPDAVSYIEKAVARTRS